MVRIWSLLAAAISLVSVRADEPDIGWLARLSEQTTVDTAGELLAVALPISVQRIGGFGNSLTLTVTAVPYRLEDENLDFDVEPITLLTESLQAPSDSFTHRVELEFAPVGYTDYLISATVTANDDPEDFTPVPGDLIIVEVAPGSWQAVDLPTYIEIINNEIIREEEELPIDGTDEGLVGIGEVIIPDDPEEIPDKPKEDGPVTPPGGNSTVTSPSITTRTTPTTPGGGDGSVTSPGGGDGSVTKSGGGGGGSTTRPGGGGGGDGGSTTTRGHGDGPRTLITILRTTTICPKPTPPPPCPTDKRELAERQLALNPAYVNAKIQYRNEDNAVRPVQGLKVKAFVDVFEGTQKVGTRTSWQTTNLNGQGTWKFSIREGQRLEVRRLVTDLNTTNWALVSSGDNGKTFTNRKLGLRLNLNPWLVEAGETKSYTITHPLSPINQALWVTNSVKYISDFALRDIIPKGRWKFLNIWYPSSAVDDEGNEKGAFIQHNGGKPYMSIKQIDAYNPATIGHELGHHVHMMANDYNRLFRGNPPHKGGHNACGDRTNANLPFNEGFATAFGLFAIDNTELQGGYMRKLKRTSETVDPTGRSYEDYSCVDHFLLNQEGRIAALLLDLVDRKLDKFPTMSGDRGFVPSGFNANDLNIRFDPRTIFWKAMAATKKPVSIEEYWTNLETLVTSSAADKAWAVYEYHYALEDFERP